MYVNIPPVLILEILGGLDRFRNDRKAAEKKIRAWVALLPTFDSKVNLHYRSLAAASLLGADIGMEGRVVVEAGQPVQDTRGEWGVVYAPQPEAVALQRWWAGDFTDTEELLGQSWRSSTRAFDMEALKSQLREQHSKLPRFKSIEEAKAHVDEVGADLSRQPSFIAKLLSDLDMPPRIQELVWNRYLADPGLLSDFAPYAYRIVEAQLLFEFSLSQELIGSRATNRVDLEYLFYLPFTQVFTSGDKHQLRLARALLRPNQTVIERDQFNADLRRLIEWKRKLSPPQREEYRRHFWSYPPPQPRTFLNDIWEKYMWPWRPFSGDAAPDHSVESEQRLLKYLRPRMEAADAVLRKGKERK